MSSISHSQLYGKRYVVQPHQDKFQRNSGLLKEELRREGELTKINKAEYNKQKQIFPLMPCVYFTDSLFQLIETCLMLAERQVCLKLLGWVVYSVL